MPKSTYAHTGMESTLVRQHPLSSVICVLCLLSSNKAKYSIIPYFLHTPTGRLSAENNDKKRTCSVPGFSA